MPLFNFKAIKNSGETYEETREAPDKLVLCKEIKNGGDTIVFAEEIKARNSFSVDSALKFFQRVKMRDKIMLAKNMGAMISAGLSMSKALSIMERQVKNPNLKSIINSINEDVKKGSTFSASLEKFPKVFAPIFVSMVRSGEESGNLPDSLKLLADQMEKNYALGQKIKGAMIYPAIILCLILAIGILMLIYVMPTLTKTFRDLNVDLPMSTKMIVFASEFLINNLVLVGILAVIVVLLVSFGLKSKKGKRIADYLSLRIPLISNLVKETNTARTARTLASLLSAGVSVVASIEVTADVLQNSYYKDVMKKAVVAVEKGDQMSKIFMETEFLYPSFMAEMVAVGEETGKMSEMLLSTGIYYENEVDQKTQNMSTIIEPFLMIGMGIAVGFFAIAIISPMYSLSDKI